MEPSPVGRSLLRKQIAARIEEALNGLNLEAARPKVLRITVGLTPRNGSPVGKVTINTEYEFDGLA